MLVKKMRLAEIINGRAAMFGCSAIGMSTLVVKTNLIENIMSQDIQSIWWLLGVYAA